MEKRLYKQVIEELNANGSVKILTIINNNENIGKKIIAVKGIHNSISYKFDDYIEKSEYYELFKNAIKDIDSKSGTHIYINGNEEIFVEEIVGKPKLIICGGGHIALPLSKIGKILGFDVSVIDDRVEFANKKRFPHVDNVICSDFDKAIDAVGISDSTYIVIVTRGHKDDRN